MSADRPWLDYRPWPINSIAADARGAHWELWAIAFFRNLVNLSLCLKAAKIWEEVQREPLTTTYYQLSVQGRDTRPFPLAERLTSWAEAE